MDPFFLLFDWQEECTPHVIPVVSQAILLRIARVCNMISVKLEDFLVSRSLE
jgi:hypothetical protein